MEQGIRAVVEIGSTGLRLLIAEIDSRGRPVILESASRPSSLGKDVFNSGTISRDSLQECVAILRSFAELMSAYGLKPEGAQVVGTSALREAANRDAFVDRVAMRSGFRIDIIEAIEENHYMFLAVQQVLGGKSAFISKTNSMIIEVGGGSTELMLLKKGKIAGAHSLRLGTLRLGQQLAMDGEGHSGLKRYLADNVRTISNSLDEELSLGSIKVFFAIGADAMIAARLAGTQGSGDYQTIKNADFFNLVDRAGQLGTEKLVSEFGLEWSEAEALVPGLLILRLFLERSSATELIVPGVSIREGLLAAMAASKNQELDELVHSQAQASALNLGRKFRFNEEHAKAVCRNTLFLFDQLKNLHGMSLRERRLLEISAILHDIGSFIKSSSHHKHSEYIVLNSDIFGLNRDDLLIIANIVRYHRHRGPQDSDTNYMSLIREDRALVLKAAAILRVADALDRDHTQRVKIERLEVKEEQIVLITAGREDLTLERLYLANKADMFEDVFGLKVVLI